VTKTMGDFLGHFIFVLATGFIGGLIGSFVANPLVQFYDLKRRIRSRMHFYDNIAAIDGDDLRKARDDLRLLGTDLLAFAETQPRTVGVLKWLGYDPEKAAHSLVGFSNSLATRDGVKAKVRADIEEALKLPLSYPNATRTRHGG
jgi:hypothetical protein